MSRAPLAMNFGKLLRLSIDEAVPDWRSSFLSYKQLKLRIKHLPPLSKAMLLDDKNEEGATSSSSDEDEGPSVTEGDDKGKQPAVESEEDFVRSVEEELYKINDFYIEREEEAVIRSKALDERFLRSVSTSKNMDDWISFQKSTVQLHGDMVLVLNWSMLNYIGVVKLLKKHDMITGKKLKEEFLAQALKHPFKSTRVISKVLTDMEFLIKVAGDGLRALTTDNANESPVELAQVAATVNEIEAKDVCAEKLDSLLGQTCAALDVWKNILPKEEGGEGKGGGDGDSQKEAHKTSSADKTGAEEPAEKRARNR